MATAVVHYKSRFSKTSVRVYGDDTSGGPPFSVLDDCAHNSPIHPDFVVFKLPLSSSALSFVPYDSTECIAYFCPDSGPLPKFAAQPWADGSRYRIASPGTYVLADGELTKHSEHYETVVDKFGGVLAKKSLPGAAEGRLALFLDIDGTLRGQGKILEFVRVWERTLALNGAMLAFNTGRSDMSVYDFIEEISRVVIPTVAICRVGTEVRWFRRPGSGWLPRNTPPIKDAEWAQELTMAHNWEYRAVLDNIQQELENHTRVRARLCLPMTRTIPIPDYTTFILTFIVRRAYVPDAMRLVREKLQAADIHVKLSVGGESTDEQYLDVINAKAGKLGGLRYIRDIFGPDFTPQSSVMCGDAGNDLDAVDHDGMEKAVIVGNCEREMDTFWKKFIKTHPAQKRVVRTKKHCAAGIVEGLRTHGFL